MSAKSLLSAALALLGCLTASCSLIKIDSPRAEAQAETIAAPLREALLQCPDRVWPGMHWRETRTVLVDNRKHRAFVWNDTGVGNLAEVAYPSLPEAFRRPGWNQTLWKERQVASLVIEDYTRDLPGMLEFFIRQGFQFAVSQTWSSNLPLPLPLQCNIYPEDWHPRNLRRQIAHFLLRAFASGDRTALGAAVYYHGKYCVEYPQDSVQNVAVDRMGGAAEYSAVLGASVGLQGCNVGDEPLADRIRKRLSTAWDVKWGNLEYRPDMREAEASTIGLLAGLLLDIQGISDWKQRVAAGETPMDILARHIEPVAVPEDSNLATRVETFTTRWNAEKKSLLDDYTARMASSDTLFLAVPFDRAIPDTAWAQIILGHYDSGRFRKFVLDLHARFSTSGKASQIEFLGAMAEIMDGRYPLGGNGYYAIPIRSSELKKSSTGSYSIDSKTVKANDLAFEFHESPITGKWLWVK